jgi:hypothetical protein
LEGVGDVLKLVLEVDDRDCPLALTSKHRETKHWKRKTNADDKKQQTKNNNNNNTNNNNNNHNNNNNNTVDITSSYRRGAAESA